MARKYRHGFKKQAEELALQVRSDMGLTWRDALDPEALAMHVNIPLVRLSELKKYGMPEKSLRHLMTKGAKEFSAALFECEGVRLIVHNPVHSTGRRASNVVHEVAHILLKHEPPDSIVEAGCRCWDESMELEADWLAGELLIPRSAALDLARREAEVDEAAARFGVSTAMVTWRLNHSGARIQVERERNARSRRHRR